MKQGNNGGKMQIEKNIPIPPRGKYKDPEKTKIAKSLEIGDSVKFDNLKDMTNFAKYVVDAHGKGSCRTKRDWDNRIFRLWRIA